MVVAIIALLAAVIFPVVATARRSAHLTSCESNLRQMWLATNLYRADYGGEGQYGDLYAMGLPIFPTFDSLPIARSFRCAAVPNGIVRSVKQFPYMRSMIEPEMDRTKPSWADYALEYRDEAVVWFDPNHNPPDVPLLAPNATKRGVGITLGGALKIRQGKGDLLDRLWWHRP